MKKLLMLMLLCGGVAAADTSLNPDQVPSVGMDFTTSRTAMDFAPAELFDPATQKMSFESPHTDLIQNQLTIDVRAPISNFVTIDVHGGPTYLESFNSANYGYSIGAGVRIYMPKDWTIGTGASPVRSHPAKEAK